MKRLSPNGGICRNFDQSEDQNDVFERFDFEAHSNSSATTEQSTRDTNGREYEGVGMANPNRIASMVGKIKANLPTSLQPWALSLMFNSQVKLARTVGVRVEELTPRRSVVKIANARKAQNHIGGIHACGMALAAESATGILLGMSVPDSRMPLCKSMAVDFTKIAKGGVTAVATLTEEQLADIEGTEKGEAKIQVTVTDESGQEPIRAQFVWAWIPKRRKPKGG